MKAHKGTRAITMWVERWTSVYTKGLPFEVASSRRDEVRSDLYEETHSASASQQSETRVARSIRSRAVRGVLQDIMWRDGEMRQFRLQRVATMTPFEKRTTRRLSWVLLIAAALTTATGLVASQRAATNLSIYAVPGAHIPILTSSVLAAIALGLLLNTATRAPGVVLLSISAWAMNWFLLAGSSNLSATFGTLVNKMSQIISAPILVLLLAVGPPLAFTAVVALVLRRLHSIEHAPPS